MGENKKLYIPEDAKLYATTKDRIFAFLKKNPKVTTGSQLLKIFPEYPVPTVYAYLRQFNDEEHAEIKQYIPHIYRVMHCLAYKYVVEKQLSMEEQKSISVLGELLDRYKDFWEV